MKINGLRLKTFFRGFPFHSMRHTTSKRKINQFNYRSIVNNRRPIRIRDLFKGQQRIMVFWPSHPKKLCGLGYRIYIGLAQIFAEKDAISFLSPYSANVLIYLHLAFSLNVLHFFSCIFLMCFFSWGIFSDEFLLSQNLKFVGFS